MTTGSDGGYSNSGSTSGNSGCETRRSSRRGVQVGGGGYSNPTGRVAKRSKA